MRPAKRRRLALATSLCFDANTIGDEEAPLAACLESLCDGLAQPKKAARQPEKRLLAAARLVSVGGCRGAASALFDS